MIVESLQVRPNTVIDWRWHFEREGGTGLRGRPRPGKPPRYTAELRRQVLAALGSARILVIAEKKRDCNAGGDEQQIASEGEISTAF